MLSTAILFLAAMGAAAVSGAAGFGGALLLLPLLVNVAGVVEAVPLLTFAQLIGNLSRAALGFAHIRWKPVAWFLLGAIPLSVLGAHSFFALPKTVGYFRQTDQFKNISSGVFQRFRGTSVAAFA